MFDYFKLKSSIGRSYNSDPDDVLKTKKALRGLGYYDEPDYGITPYPDTSLIRGIEKFQRDNGLKADGVMKPDGETMWMLGSVVGDIFQNAQNLQSMGRNGDTILAHISPKEAKLLKKKGGAGTIHPVTGLLEFSDDSKKKGKYIWHTAGDSKVRSSHADRDGKTFSWDSPPDGGHPGEAPNCRCTTEDVPEENTKCDELKVLMEQSWDRYDALFKLIEDAKRAEMVSEKILDDLRTRRSGILFEMGGAVLPDRASGKSPIGAIVGAGKAAIDLERLQRELEETDLSIEIEERTLAKAKEKRDQLEHKRKNEQQYAEELSRRYKACLKKNGKPE